MAPGPKAHDMFENIIVNAEESQLENSPDVTPSPSDPEWTPYILSLLKEDEFNKQKIPTVAGIRRIVPLVMGKILKSETQVVVTPSPDNDERCCTVHTIELKDFDGDILTFSGAVDLCKKDTMKPFDKNLVSSCCTKSEGKALRRLLKLNVILNEELIEGGEGSGNDEKCTAAQLSYIENLCIRNKFNLEAVVKKYFSVQKLSQLNHIQAADILSKLGEMQKDHSKVPDELKGYISTWKESF